MFLAGMCPMYTNLSVVKLSLPIGSLNREQGLTGVPLGHLNILLFFIFRYINVLYTIYIYYSVMTLMISNQHLYIYPQTHATHKQKPNRTTLSLSLSLYLSLSLSLLLSHGVYTLAAPLQFRETSRRMETIRAHSIGAVIYKSYVIKKVTRRRIVWYRLC